MLEKNKCESCGMPLKHLADCGTNKNGTVNREFCRHCYQSGRFLDHGITLEQKIEKSIALAQKKMGMSKEQATTMANSTLPTLKRWKGGALHE